FEGVPRDRSEALDVRIVMYDEHVVGRATKDELHTVGAELPRRRERLDRVLGRGPRRATMCQDERAVGHGRDSLEPERVPLMGTKVLLRPLASSVTGPLPSFLPPLDPSCGVLVSGCTVPASGDGRLRDPQGGNSGIDVDPDPRLGR